MLSKCSWAAFWQLLGSAWVAFGLNLEPLGRLLVSHWDLVGAFGADLEVFWAPLLRHLGRLGRFLGQLGSSWPPNGCQMVAKWTPNACQIGRHNDCQCQRASLERQSSYQMQLNSWSSVLQSPDGDAMQH